MRSTTVRKSARFGQRATLVGLVMLLAGTFTTYAGLEREIKIVWTDAGVSRTSIDPDPNPNGPNLPLQGIIGQARYPEQLYWVRLVNGTRESGPFWTSIKGKVRVLAEITGGPPTQKNLTVRINDAVETTVNSGGAGKTFEFDIPKPGNEYIVKVLLRSNDVIPLNFRLSVDVLDQTSYKTPVGSK